MKSSTLQLDNIQTNKMRTDMLLRSARKSRGDRMKFGNRHTPDVPLIEAYDEHWLFVYGDHMKHYNRHGFMQHMNAELCGRFITVDQAYVLMTYTPGAEDENMVVAMDEWSHHSAHIYGELYRVSPDLIKVLDQIMSNGFKYKREQTLIRALRNKKSNLKVWWYKGIPEHWESLQNNYNWRFGLLETTKMYEEGPSAKPTEFFRFRPKDQYVNNWYRHISADQCKISTQVPSSRVSVAPLAHWNKRYGLQGVQGVLDDIDNESPLYTKARYQSAII